MAFRLRVSPPDGPVSPVPAFGGKSVLSWRTGLDQATRDLQDRPYHETLPETCRAKPPVPGHTLRPSALFRPGSKEAADQVSLPVLALFLLLTVEVNDRFFSLTALRPQRLGGQERI